MGFLSVEWTCALALGLGLSLTGSSLHGDERVRNGLLSLYDFQSHGDIVKDVAGAGAAVDLRIANTNDVQWLADGLEVRDSTLIRSDRPATRISDAIRLSGRFTVEAWVRPASTSATGPARIVTLSPNGSQRNFTLGQDGARFEVRMRTTEVSDNGIPAIATSERSLTTNLTHVVYTRDRVGRARIYVDGELSVEHTVPWGWTFTTPCSTRWGPHVASAPPTAR